MNPKTININSRYYLTPVEWQFPKPDDKKAFDVIDRALEYQFRPAVVFSNGTGKECRDWVLRNTDEPGEHSPGPWKWWDKNSGRPNNYDLTKLISGKTDQDHDGHTIFTNYGGEGDDALGTSPRDRANAALLKTAPKLLALLEQYHSSMPTKESGKLICEARGWTIQE
jgi:hypothetical protein